MKLSERETQKSFSIPTARHLPSGLQGREESVSGRTAGKKGRALVAGGLGRACTGNGGIFCGDATEKWGEKIMSPWRWA